MASGHMRGKASVMQGQGNQSSAIKLSLSDIFPKKHAASFGYPLYIFGSHYRTNHSFAYSA